MKHTARSNLPALIIACILSLSIMNSCTGDEPVKIGFIGGLTGRVADLGISGRNGAILAIEERNRSGGINGRPVQLIAVDDNQDVDAAKKAFNSLLDQNVKAIIGHMTSSMSVSTVPLANKHRIVLMSPTSTTTDLNDIDDYFFRVCATTDTYGAQMARHFRNTKKLDKVTVIYDLRNISYTRSWISHFNKEFKKLGGEIVQQVTFTSGPETQFSTVVKKALEVETDGIVISSNAVDAAMICQQIYKKNQSLPVGISEWAATEKLIDLGGIAMEQIIVSQFFDRYSTAPEYIRFKKKFHQRFGQEPGFPSVGAYDATNVILDALEKYSEEDDLKQTIHTISSFNGIQGKISFNRFGDSDRLTFLSEIRNGKFISTTSKSTP